MSWLSFERGPLVINALLVWPEVQYLLYCCSGSFLPTCHPLCFSGHSVDQVSSVLFQSLSQIVHIKSSQLAVYPWTHDIRSCGWYSVQECHGLSLGGFGGLNGSGWSVSLMFQAPFGLVTPWVYLQATDNLHTLGIRLKCFCSKIFI